MRKQGDLKEMVKEILIGEFQDRLIEEFQENIDRYFKNLTPEQFKRDCERAGIKIGGRSCYIGNMVRRIINLIKYKLHPNWENQCENALEMKFCTLYCLKRKGHFGMHRTTESNVRWKIGVGKTREEG